MNTTLTKEAKGFVDEVVDYLKRGEKGSSIGKVSGLINKVSVQAQNQNSAQVFASTALTVSEKETLSRILEKLLGHTIKLEEHVDPTILGGIRIQVGDWVFDTSLKSQLEEMASQLI